MNPHLEGIFFFFSYLICFCVFFVPATYYMIIKLTLKINSKKLPRSILVNFPIRVFFSLVFTMTIKILLGFSTIDSLQDFLQETIFLYILFVFIVECFLIEHKKQIFIWVVTLISYFTLEIFKTKLDRENLPSVFFPYRNTILAIFLIVLAIYGIYKIRVFIKYKIDKKYFIKESLRLSFYFCIAFVLHLIWSKKIGHNLPYAYFILIFYMSLRFIFIKNRKFTSLKDYFKYVFPILVLIVLIFLGYMNKNDKNDFLKSVSQLWGEPIKDNTALVS